MCYMVCLCVSLVCHRFSVAHFTQYIYINMCCCVFFLLFSFRCVFCSIRFVSFCLFLSCVDIYTCFESVCLSHIRVYRRQCVYSHLESPVGTTNDTIFTNITVLSFVSARYRFCFGSQLHYSVFCLYTKNFISQRPQTHKLLSCFISAKFKIRKTLVMQKTYKNTFEFE